MSRILLAVALFSVAIFAADVTLETAKAEDNLEKRSEKALQAAQYYLDQFRKSGELHDQEQVRATLANVRAGVELCVDSLQASGKDPRRNPKYFKKAEIALRKLNRHLEDLRVALSADERAPVADLLGYTQQVQENMLLGIFTKKK